MRGSVAVALHTSTTSAEAAGGPPLPSARLALRLAWNPSHALVTSSVTFALSSTSGLAAASWAAPCSISFCGSVVTSSTVPPVFLSSPSSSCAAATFSVAATRTFRAQQRGFADA